MATKQANRDPLQGKLTITIEEAGKLLGLSRNSAYAAAARGEIPTVTYGRRKVVPVEALRRQLLAWADEHDATQSQNAADAAPTRPREPGRRAPSSVTKQARRKATDAA